MDDDQKGNTSLFAFGGTNVKHKFKQLMQPGPQIKAVQGKLSQKYKTLCRDMYLFLYFCFYIQ
jgi:hypothetical protein